MRRRRPDKIFLWTAGALIVSGFFILTSASIGLLARDGADFYSVLFRQFLFGIVGGGILLYITYRIDYRKWKQYALPFFILSFLLMLAVFLPVIGLKLGGARRWIKIWHFTFQPAELLKFSFVVYLAAWMAKRKGDIKSFKFGFLPFVAIISFVGLLLVSQPDVGTLGIIAVTSMSLFFLGGGKFSHVVLLILLGIGLVSVLIYMAPYRMARFTTFLDPSLDPTGIGYHLKQSLIAFGSGGIFGRGLGMSVQKFRYLPEPIGDSIFAVFGEEFGFVGTLFLIGLFLLFLYRGFYISTRAPDDFSRLLGSGIVILIVLQAFINIAAMTGLMPLTGLPLSFVSKGGSALAVTLAEIGVLLNISKFT